VRAQRHAELGEHPSCGEHAIRVANRKAIIGFQQAAEATPVSDDSLVDR